MLTNEKPAMKKILVLNGVNLNMFGHRDPAQYGTITLAEIDAKLRDLAQTLGVNGTPALYFPSGERVPGYMPLDKIEKLLK